MASQSEDDAIRIPVSVGGDLSSFYRFALHMSYNSSITLNDVIEAALKQIHQEYHPKRFYINVIYDNSFINKNVLGLYSKDRKEWDNLCATPLTQYDKMNIMRKGLSLNVLNKYTHTVYQENISCPYINDSDEKQQLDPMQCPHYKAMFAEQQYSLKHLNHLFEETHFKDELNEKPKCKQGLQCESLVRLNNGQNLLADQCHIKLYNHPPRNDRQIKLESNMHSFLCNTENNQNYPVYTPNDDDYKTYKPFDDKEVQKGNGNPGYINALIEEVIRNGFKYDLFGVQNTSTSNKSAHYYPILSVVDSKYHHIRHQQVSYRLNRGELLALILYTSCDCNYDLCASQRKGDYAKWKWFDYCLFQGTKNLGGKQQGLYKLYSGLSGVKVSKKEIISGFFPTYTSTSWSKYIAESFMNTKSSKGMIIEIDEQYRNTMGVLCCNVSWISKFPDECEILIARSAGNFTDNNRFTLNVVDESNGIQTVALKKKAMSQKEQLLDLFGDQLANRPDLMQLLQ